MNSYDDLLYIEDYGENGICLVIFWLLSFRYISVIICIIIRNIL